MRPSCHICRRPIPDDEQRKLVIRNGLIVHACHRCWFLWPDTHKLETERTLCASTK
jgi:hypothetical protein